MNMMRTPYRSLFWPIVLIGVGLVWFLSNLNVIPNFNPLALLNLWPLLLIALGLDLIIGRRSPLFGLLIGLVTVGAAIAILLAVPSLGKGGEYTTDRFLEPGSGATSAVINIDASSVPVRMHSLSDSANLFDATIDHTGTMDFNVSGEAQKQITLRQRNGSFNFFFGFSGFNAHWDIGLNSKVPLSLNYHGASGSNNLDLSGLQLTSVKIDGASGSNDVTLPASSSAYTVNYSGASGSLNMNILSGSDVTVTLDGGSGSLNLNVPSGAAVHVEVRDSGSGSVNVRGGMTRQGGSNGKTGTWETNGFSSAAHKITIIARNLGSGCFNIN
jgi:hypothetical protein